MKKLKITWDEVERHLQEHYGLKAVKLMIIHTDGDYEHSNPDYIEGEVKGRECIISQNTLG